MRRQMETRGRIGNYSFVPVVISKLRGGMDNRSRSCRVIGKSVEECATSFSSINHFGAKQLYAFSLYFSRTRIDILIMYCFLIFSTFKGQEELALVVQFIRFFVLLEMVFAAVFF